VGKKKLKLEELEKASLLTTTSWPCCGQKKKNILAMPNLHPSVDHYSVRQVNSSIN
jgi:hypothetical protein